MTRVLLSKAAEADLEEIDDYTIEHFGLDQGTAFWLWQICKTIWIGLVTNRLNPG